jgi:D-apionate oxidoisomerase
MQQKITLVGAGGKMGCRLTDNLKPSSYEVSYLEVNPAGIERVRSRGVDVTEPETAIREADIVIFAVPDVAIAKVAAQYVPRMKRGAMGMCLDPAAPLAGALPPRDDVAYFAAHPSHPSVFNWEPTPEAHFDYFGGIKARQTMVCALIQGTEEDYVRGEALARTIYAPVTKSHRITLEQMGILEPALSETFCASLVTLMKEAVDVVVARGVPREAATDFFLGHLNIELALLFDQLPGGRFSDAALKAIEIGRQTIVKEDWKRLFEPDHVMQQIRAIT